MPETTTAAEALAEKAKGLSPKKARRLIAISEVLAGRSVEEVAAVHGVTPNSIRNWVARFQTAGIEGLTKDPPTLKLAKGNDPQELYRRLKADAYETWRWLREERKVSLTLAQVYKWRQRLSQEHAL